jgi:hypothetical protein
MKPIEKDELYAHVCQFLKAKGVEMKDGSYPRGIQAGCSLLTDAINLSQKGIKRAKVEIDKNVERMRQVIHEKTAPKAPPKAGEPPKAAQTPKQAASNPKTAAPRRKRTSPKR